MTLLASTGLVWFSNILVERSDVLMNCVGTAFPEKGTAPLATLRHS